MGLIIKYFKIAIQNLRTVEITPMGRLVIRVVKGIIRLSPPSRWSGRFCSLSFRNKGLAGQRQGISMKTRDMTHRETGCSMIQVIDKQVGLQYGLQRNRLFCRTGERDLLSYLKVSKSRLWWSPQRVREPLRLFPAVTITTTDGLREKILKPDSDSKERFLWQS